MAEVKAQITELQLPGHGDAYKVVWPNLANNDTGEPVALFGFNDRSFQVEGTFGGGTATISGTLDDTNFRGQRDPTGNALTFTSAALKAVLEAVAKTRPEVTGGDGTTSLTVTMIAVRTRK